MRREGPPSLPLAPWESLSHRTIQGLGKNRALEAGSAWFNFLLGEVPLWASVKMTQGPSTCCSWSARDGAA